MKPRTIALGLLGLVYVTSTAFGQSEWEFLSDASNRIRARNPEVTVKLIAEDITVIKAAFPAIRSQMSEKRFSEPEIKHATASGWSILRAPKASLAPLTVQRFTTHVTKLGRLEIKSVPDKADIAANEIPAGEQTNGAWWLPVGTHEIRLTKPEYHPEKEIRKVEEGRNPPLIKTLTPK